MILNIWVVFLKSDKKQIEYLPVTITELFNVYKKFRISNSFPSKFKFLYSDQWWHPCFTCLNITQWNSSLFKQIWRISYGLKSTTEFSSSSFFLKSFPPFLLSRKHHWSQKCWRITHMTGAGWQRLKRIFLLALDGRVEEWKPEMPHNRES